MAEAGKEESGPWNPGFLDNVAQKKEKLLLHMSNDVLETESGPCVDVRARESALGAIDRVGLAHKVRIRCASHQSHMV